MNQCFEILNLQKLEELLKQFGWKKYRDTPCDKLLHGTSATSYKWVKNQIQINIKIRHLDSDYKKAKMYISSRHWRTRWYAVPTKENRQEPTILYNKNNKYLILCSYDPEDYYYNYAYSISDKDLIKEYSICLDI